MPDSTVINAADDEVASSKKKSSTRRVPLYKPQGISPPRQFLPNLDYIVVLDQGQEGAAVGHGMATMINYLLRERGIKEQVSARMLQQVSKQYDNMPLNKDMGSFLRSGMRGWSEHGVCPESLWPYKALDFGKLTPDRSRAALKYKPSSYQKLPKDVSVLRAAIYEHHAAVVGLSVHDGWMKPMRNGVIDFSPDKNTVGGHCVAVLGYTAEGFIIQNSWGPAWGNLKIGSRLYPGAALLTYPDFEASYDGEGFVATLPDALVGQPLLRRAGYKSDTLESEDRLHIMQDVEAVCSVLATRDVKPPLALGLFGNWGTGKSFFMARMYEETDSLAKLEREHPGETPYCSQIVQIRFNAWHYLDANLWASLVSELFNRLFAAVSDPSETTEQTRKRVVRLLGQARGLYRQSLMELEQASQEREIAEGILSDKTAQVKSQKASLAEVSDQLVTLLANEPKVRENLDQLAENLGAPRLAESYSALKSQAQEIKTKGGKLRRLLYVVFDPQGRRDRLILLIGVLAGPILIGALVSYLTRNASGLLQDISGIGGPLVSLGALIAKLLQGNKVLGSLQDTVAEVERVRDSRLATLIQPEQDQLEQTARAEREAQTQLEAAGQRVESLKKELGELSPGNQIQAFMKDRSSSEDYKKQLGLISLIRRDFERLSELLQTSEALEARWYERRRAAQEAGKKFTKPKRRLLPFQRILLYIDDLDRCQPDRVIEVLEAVHLLLAFPLFVVVVAVDPRWLRQCLEIHYPDLLSMDETAEADQEGLRQPSTPQDYLEKIFQIPFYLRPINDAGYRGLIDGLAAADVAVSAQQQPTTGPDSKRRAKSGKMIAGELSLPMGKHADTPGVARTGSRSQPETAAGAKKVVPPDKLNPEQLKFQTWELEDMKRLSPLFRTPRAVKRFVNTYRLVRVGIPSSDLSGFEGTAEVPGRYRMAQVLLAIVSGYPNVAPRFLQRLLDQSRAADAATATWGRFLDQCITLAAAEKKSATDSRPSKGKGQDASSKTTRTTVARERSKAVQQNKEREVAYFWQEWIQLSETLRQISLDGYLPGNLSEYYDLVPRVARFSFSVSMLPE